MDVSQRLKYLLRESGLTQNEIAKRTGFSQSYISAVSNGKKIPLENLVKFCNLLNIELADFFQPISEKKAIPSYIMPIMDACSNISEKDAPLVRLFLERLAEPSAGNVVTPLNQIGDGEGLSNADFGETDDCEEDFPRFFLPLLGSAAAGLPIYNPDDDGNMVAVPEEYADPDRFLAVCARGDSMEPKINSGDIVIAQRGLIPGSGQAALVCLAGMADDEYTIKRIYPKHDQLVLRSYNDAYQDMIYSPDDLRSCDAVVHVIPSSDA